MTDRAVVVILRRVRETQERDRVLMLVVRKLDRELKLRGWIAKRVTHLITRRRLRMTNRTDRRPRAAEELRTVTAHARLMARIIRDVRERGCFTPVFGWDFVACIAGCFMFGCGMGEFRVIDR